MADRRCFHKNVIESDRFYKLPPSAQALYLHLTMQCDDDGFVNCAESIASRISDGKAALRILVNGGFLLCFGDVYLLRDFRVGNTLKNDRVRPPAYPDIAEKVWIGKNRAYSPKPIPGCPTLMAWKTGLDPSLESKENRIEPNGTEGNRTEPKECAAGAVESGFQRLWDAYPEIRRGVKDSAREAYCARIHGEKDARMAIENLRFWKNSQQWTKSGGQFIPFLNRWLEKGLWKFPPPADIRHPLGAYGYLGPAELEAIRNVMASPGGP